MLDAFEPRQQADLFYHGDSWFPQFTRCFPCLGRQIDIQNRVGLEKKKKKSVTTFRNG